MLFGVDCPQHHPIRDVQWPVVNCCLVIAVLRYHVSTVRLVVIAWKALVTSKTNVDCCFVFISSSEGAAFFRLLVIVTSAAIHAVASCEDGGSCERRAVRAAWHPICRAQHGWHGGTKCALEEQQQNDVLNGEDRCNNRGAGGGGRGSSYSSSSIDELSICNIHCIGNWWWCCW